MDPTNIILSMLGCYAFDGSRSEFGRKYGQVVQDEIKNTLIKGGVNSDEAEGWQNTCALMERLCLVISYMDGVLTVAFQELKMASRENSATSPRELSSDSDPELTCSSGESVLFHLYLDGERRQTQIAGIPGSFSLWSFIDGVKWQLLFVLQRENGTKMVGSISCEEGLRRNSGMNINESARRSSILENNSPRKRRNRSVTFEFQWIEAGNKVIAETMKSYSEDETLAKKQRALLSKKITISVADLKVVRDGFVNNGTQNTEDSNDSNNILTKEGLSAGKAKALLKLGMSCDDVQAMKNTNNLKALEILGLERKSGAVSPKNEEDRNYFTRIVVLGNSGEGKSTLVRAITSKNPKLMKKVAKSQESSSNEGGVSLHKWEVDNLDFVVWDFGLETDLLVATHTMFLSENTLYLVVFDASANPDSGFFWIASILSFKHDSPVILVATNVEKAKKNSINVTFEKYQKSYPTLAGILPGAIKLSHYKAIREKIIEVASRMPHIGKELPGKLRVVTNRLQEIQREMLLCGKPGAISWREFCAIALDCGLTGIKASRIASLLHDMGVIVYPVKEKNIFLDHNTLVEMLKTIFKEKNRAASEGKLFHRDLPLIWKNFSEEQYPFLLAILRSLDIIISVRPSRQKDKRGLSIGLGMDDSYSLIPALFPDKPAPKMEVLWRMEGVTTAETCSFGRVFQFHFLPPSLCSRLLVRVMVALGEGMVHYRNCVAVKRGQEVALIVSKMDIHQIELYVRANYKGGMYLTILDIMESLISSSYAEQFKEISIVCPHCLDNNLCRNNPTLYNFDYCRDMLESGVGLVVCTQEGFIETISTDAVLPDFAVADAEHLKVEYKQLKDLTQIGKGGFATVSKAELNGKLVAVKILEHNGNENSDSKENTFIFTEFRREITLMSRLRHPCIVNLVGVCISPLAMVIDYVPHGDLWSWIESCKEPISRRILLRIALDIARGISYLHEQNPPVLHRDLKSPNILVADPTFQAPVVVKVCDFGVSTRYPVVYGESESAPVDNPRWCAPESLHLGEYSQATDTYAFGIVMSELITRSIPFLDTGITFMSHLEKEIINGLRPNLPPNLDEDIKSLVCMCWHQEASERPTIKEVEGMIQSMMGEDYHKIPPYPADELPDRLQRLRRDKPLVAAQSPTVMNLAKLAMSAEKSRKNNRRKAITSLAAETNPVTTTKRLPFSKDTMIGLDKEQKMRKLRENTHDS